MTDSPHGRGHKSRQWQRRMAAGDPARARACLFRMATGKQVGLRVGEHALVEDVTAALEAVTGWPRCTQQLVSKDGIAVVPGKPFLAYCLTRHERPTFTLQHAVWDEQLVLPQQVSYAGIRDYEVGAGLRPRLQFSFTTRVKCTDPACAVSVVQLPGEASSELVPLPGVVSYDSMLRSLEFRLSGPLQPFRWHRLYFHGACFTIEDTHPAGSRWVAARRRAAVTAAAARGESTAAGPAGDAGAVRPAPQIQLEGHALRRDRVPDWYLTFETGGTPVRLRLLAPLTAPAQGPLLHPVELPLGCRDVAQLKEALLGPWREYRLGQLRAEASSCAGGIVAHGLARSSGPGHSATAAARAAHPGIVLSPAQRSPEETVTAQLAGWPHTWRVLLLRDGFAEPLRSGRDVAALRDDDVVQLVGEEAGAAAPAGAAITGRAGAGGVAAGRKN
jgi:hypothetical protein